MTISTEITLGNIIGAVSIMVTIAIAFAGAMSRIRDANDKAMGLINEYHQENERRLTALETRMEAIWDFFTNRMERRSRRPEDYGG